LFELTRYVSVASLVPDVSLVISIHDALLVAVHVQYQLDAMIDTEPVPLRDLKFCEVGESWNVHGAGEGAAAGAD
jgi:hypothetical protein